MRRTLTLFDPQDRTYALGLRPFFRIDIHSLSGHLIAKHYIELDDVVWC